MQTHLQRNWVVTVNSVTLYYAYNQNLTSTFTDSTVISSTKELRNLEQRIGSSSRVFDKRENVSQNIYFEPTASYTKDDFCVYSQKKTKEHERKICIKCIAFTRNAILSKFLLDPKRLNDPAWCRKIKWITESNWSLDELNKNACICTKST